MATPFTSASIKFTADDSALKPQLAGIEKAVGEAASRMASVAKTAMLGVTAAIGAAIAAAGGLAALVKISADAGDSLAKMSQRTAIGVETLSGYKLAADLAGISLEDMGTALQKASRNIADAAKGTGDGAGAFDALGIRVTDSNGKLKTAEQIMLEVADKFAAMEDGAQKTALAQEIFGRSGAALIPLLNQGSAAIATQRKEADQLGVTWTTAQAKMAEAMNDNFTRIGASLAGFRNQVATYLMPFINQFLEAGISKIKEWGASGELRIWAAQTAEAIVQGTVWVVEGLAEIAKAAGWVVDAFRVIEGNFWASRLVFDAFVLAFLTGIEKMLGAAAWFDEKLGKAGIAGSLRSAQAEVREWAESWDAAGKRAADRLIALDEAFWQQNPAVDRFVGGVKSMSETVRQWASDAIRSGAKAAAGMDDSADKTEKAAGRSGQAVLKSAKEQVKALDEAFKALQTRGEASLQETLDYLQRRAALFRTATPERMQAEAEAFKFAQEMADKLFAHEQAIGLKSIRDEIDRQKQKAAAAKEGSEARMKAEEAVYQKEEELRNKSRSAALGILGEVQERLAAKGITTVTPADVQREMMDLQRERAQQFAETAGRFGAGGAVDIGALIEGIKSGGKLEDFQKQLQQLGGFSGIFKGAGQIGVGAMTEQLGLGVTSQTIKDLLSVGREDLVQQMLSKFGPGGNEPSGAAWTGPGEGVATGFQTGMEKAVASVDEGLGKIEARVNESSSKIAKTIYGNLEDWLVNRLTAEMARA